MDATSVRTAHADAWAAHGRFREPYGGGVARLPGIRVMASGLPHPQWNNGDVVDASLVDVEQVREWYAERGVPWGVRVPRGVPWPHGRHLFHKRLMVLTPEAFRPVAPPADVVLRPATREDVDAAVAVDAASYETDPTVMRPWIGPMLGMPGLDYCLAEIDGRAVGVGHSLVTTGDAGPAAHIAGIGVLPDGRRRGIGAAVSAWAVERGFSAGARFAHLHPDTEEAARIYRGLGFVEVAGFDVYVDLS